MQIAQIAPLMEAVPPKLYGGSERIVAYLTDELVTMGHEVTLFASGDSVTTATLEPGSATAGRLCSPCSRELRSAPATSMSCTSTAITSAIRCCGEPEYHSSPLCTAASICPN